MSFATQGAISGTISNSSMFRGSVAGKNGGAVAPTSLNIDEYKKEIKENIEQTKQEDFANLDKEYAKTLDEYSSEESQQEMYDQNYNKLRVNIDRFYSNPYWWISTYNWGQYGWKMSAQWHQRDLNSLSKNLKSQIKTIVDEAQKAKDLTDVKATESQIKNENIRNLQNELIDYKNALNNQYQSMYSNQLKNIRNFSLNRLMGMKKTRHHFTKKLRMPVLKYNFVKPTAKTTNLDKQFTRNFRKMI